MRSASSGWPGRCEYRKRLVSSLRPIVLWLSFAVSDITGNRHSDPSLHEVESLRRRVGELERANAILEARDGRYRDLIENAKDMIWTLDPDGAVTFLNSACETITGYTKQELTGKELAKLARAEDLDGTPFEIRILAKDGSPIELEVNSAILDRDGKPAGFLAIARDITVRKQAHEILRRNAQEFEFLFANHPQPMWVF